MSHIEGVSTHASYKRALILALWPTMWLIFIWTL